MPNTKKSDGQTSNQGTFWNSKNSLMRDKGYKGSGSVARYFKNCQYGEKDIEPRRYFYSGKASKRDRDEGLENFEYKKFYSSLNTKNGKGECLDGNKTPIRKNTHATVKPTSLMQYLIRLVTPNGGTVLDPFNGSGSTGKAVMYENKERNKDYKYIGIELNEEYLEISKARIEYFES